MILHIVVRGRVQGVGYRYFAQGEAVKSGLVGWVRNNPNAEVEALAQGDPSKLDIWVQKLHQGPLSARVDEVLVEETESKLQYTTFIIK